MKYRKKPVVIDAVQWTGRASKVSCIPVSLTYLKRRMNQWSNLGD